MTRIWFKFIIYPLVKGSWRIIIIIIIIIITITDLFIVHNLR